MSAFIYTHLAPYRGNLSKECMDILAEDCELVCSSLKSRGLLFIVAFITLMSVSVLKVIVHFFTQIQKPRMTYKHLDIDRGMSAEDVTDILLRREAVDEVENHDNYNPNTKAKNQRAESLNALRGYLYQHDLTLHATVLKRVEHRCTQEELLEMYRLGKYTKDLSTAYVTFGRDIDILLKEVLGDIVNLRHDRLSNETYIKIVNDEYIPLKQALEDTYNEPVKILLDVDTGK